MSQRLQRTMIVVGSVILLLGGGLWFFWPEPLPPPDESKRLIHPAGYSLIVPEHFNVNVNHHGDGELVDSITINDSRYAAFPPTLSVNRFRTAPDFESLSNRGFKQKGVFLGNEATMMDGPTGRGHAQMWNHRMVVKFGDTWFEIAAADPQYFRYDGHMYKKYLETFRYAPRPAIPAPPTTAPATTTATTGPSTRGS